jgi:uncharacterized protein YutE (UPF0331/DUF86 family)
VTDPELVRKRLAFVATCLADLRRLARVDVLETDLRERRFVEHTLQLAIQAALDVASHLVAAKRLEEPRTNRELFERLGEAGLVDSGLARRLGDMASFRNVLVHGYTEVDLDIVRDVVANRLGDLDAFVKTVHALLASGA